MDYVVGYLKEKNRTAYLTKKIEVLVREYEKEIVRSSGVIAQLEYQLLGAKQKNGSRRSSKRSSMGIGVGKSSSTSIIR